MKNVKKVIKRAFQSGVSFGAGLTSLIISFYFSLWLPRFNRYFELSNLKQE